MSGRRALFLDRDGTIIYEREYLADPDQVELIPGVAAALRAFQAAGYALAVVTNQSGIARGYYGEREFAAVQQRVEALLAREGIRLAGVFMCPHHPDFTGPCDCRKPGPGLYREAAAELGIDLAASLYVGDRVHDALPALHFGGRGFVVATGYGAVGNELPAGVETARDLAEIARRERLLPD